MSAYVLQFTGASPTMQPGFGSFSCPQASCQRWASSGVSRTFLWTCHGRRVIRPSQGASQLSQNGSPSEAAPCPEVPSVHLHTSVSGVGAASGSCMNLERAERTGRPVPMPASASVSVRWPVSAWTQGSGWFRAGGLLPLSPESVAHQLSSGAAKIKPSFFSKWGRMPDRGTTCMG